MDVSESGREQKDHGVEKDWGPQGQDSERERSRYPCDALSWSTCAGLSYFAFSAETTPHRAHSVFVAYSYAGCDAGLDDIAGTTHI